MPFVYFGAAAERKKPVGLGGRGGGGVLSPSNRLSLFLDVSSLFFHPVTLWFLLLLDSTEGSSWGGWGGEMGGGERLCVLAHLCHLHVGFSTGPHIPHRHPNTPSYSRAALCCSMLIFSFYFHHFSVFPPIMQQFCFIDDTSGVTKAV